MSIFGASFVQQHIEPLLRHGHQLRTVVLDDRSSRCPPLSSHVSPHLSLLTIQCRESPDFLHVAQPFPHVHCLILRNIYERSRGWTQFLAVQGPFITSLHLDFSHSVHRLVD
ncbi:hypothetical protein BV25DRAFT_686572 [Artomyces pyxidatus]|uniref:Uncharacterized protein n=1 Tax=Artomyces pyxidatus TaxID=48021 RepID=A0ACB8T1K7_9AGAM|nr:hypothetical protein BV25DRAFT_686572 [Artomyces pyxidatus]